MTKFKIPAKMSRKFHRAALKLKKASPEILIAVGVVGVGVSMVGVAKASTKAGSILEEAKSDLEAIRNYAEKPEFEEKYTEKDKTQAIATVYVQTGIKYVKLYGPSVALCAASLGCIIKSHKIMKKRNVALAAAYAAVDKGFKDYRGRVIERLGKELDYELLHNIKSQQVEEVVKDEKTGKEEVVTKTVQVMDPNERSPFSIIWDDGNVGWTKDPEKNKFFLIQQQNWANEKLKSQGHLFLNEVYDMLGVKRTKAGAIVGWIYDSKAGDGYVDFGLFNMADPGAVRFINGHERSIVLDFNVQGNIYDLI